MTALVSVEINGSKFTLAKGDVLVLKFESDEMMRKVLTSEDVILWLRVGSVDYINRSANLYPRL